MSIRPVKRVVQSQPTLEGAGVQLRRAFGFGDTNEFDPFLLFDDFRNDNPDDYLAGFPVASASRHRDDHLRARRHRRARRQPRQPRHARRRRRAVDDGRQRHPASGDAEGRRAGPHARLPALGQPAVVAEDDRRRAIRTSPAQDIPEVDRRRRDAVRVVCGEFWGKTRPGRRRRGRSALPRRLGAARPAQDAAGRDVAARVRLRVRRLGHVPRRVGSRSGVQTEQRRRHATRRAATTSATARWCSSTAATKSSCRPATRASASCSSRASRSRSRSPGTGRS